MRASRIYQVWALSLLVLGLGGCIDPFEPEVPVQETKAMVVDGFINSNGRSTIKLSYTFDLNSTTGPLFETKAQVFIQAQGTGEQYLLQEVLPGGTYISDSLVLDPQRQYRLFFRTRDKKEYASSFEEVKTTPPIDELTWKVVPRGLELYANTHDDTGKSIYYRWDYTETWEFTSAMQSIFVWENGKMRGRLPSEDIYHCWQTVNSPSIKLTNTLRLSQVQVKEFPIIEFLAGDTRLRYKYSALVRQYALSEEGYQYWETLRKNTETIGSLFDPLPSQPVGNVRCTTHRNDLVLGYVGVGSVTQKRIFISAQDLPRWDFKTGYEDCGLQPADVLPLDNVPYSDILEETFGSGEYIPIFNYNHPIYGAIYTSYPKECADCRVRGTKTRPSFWE